MKCKLLYTLAFAFLVPVSAFAGASTTVADIANSMMLDASQFGTFAMAASMVAGIATGAAGVMKFKEHAEDPRQTKLMKPMLYMLASGLLVGLPYILDTTSETVTGAKSADRATLKGNIYNVR